MLTGSITAASQAEAIEKAKARAVQWYGDECVAVTLIDPTDQTETIENGFGEPVREVWDFTADYEAREKHTRPSESNPLRPFVCTKCGDTVKVMIG